MMTDNLLSPYQEEMLLAYVETAETTAIGLRFLAADLLREQRDSPTVPVSDLMVKVDVDEHGWLSVTLPVMLPRRGSKDKAMMLVHPIYQAVRHYFSDKPIPHFSRCVLVYEHIYGSRSRRFIDHDNLELKHCQDALEGCFLDNDTSALCCAFQCSHRGEADSTRVWILTPEQFPRWLQEFPERWSISTENTQNR